MHKTKAFFIVFVCILILRTFSLIVAHETTAGLLIYATRDYGNVDGNTDIYSVQLNDSVINNLTNNPAEDTLPSVNVKTGKIAFLSNRSGQNEIYVMDMDGSNQLQLTEDAKPEIAPPAWSPDGDVVVFSSFKNTFRQLYSVNIQTKEVTDLIESSANDTEPSWSPDGTHFVFISDGYVKLLNTTNNEVELLFKNLDFSKELVWSPDSSKLAFASYISDFTAKTGNFEIFVIDMTTHKLLQITENSFDDTTPSWSPDSNYLAFTSNVGTDLNNYEIAIARSDGNSEPVTVTNHLANDRCPVWSSDGNSIIFVSDRRVPFESNDLYLLNLDDEKLTQLSETDGNELCPLNYIVQNED